MGRGWPWPLLPCQIWSFDVKLHEHNYGDPPEKKTLPLAFRLSASLTITWGIRRCYHSDALPRCLWSNIESLTTPINAVANVLLITGYPVPPPRPPRHLCSQQYNLRTGLCGFTTSPRSRHPFCGNSLIFSTMAFSTCKLCIEIPSSLLFYQPLIMYMIYVCLYL